MKKTLKKIAGTLSIVTALSLIAYPIIDPIVANAHGGYATTPTSINETINENQKNSYLMLNDDFYKEMFEFMDKMHGDYEFMRGMHGPAMFDYMNEYWNTDGENENVGYMRRGYENNSNTTGNQINRANYSTRGYGMGGMMGR